MITTMRRTALAMLLTGLAMTAQVRAETPDEHNARMQWWREARFGLFIHWGLYAVPAGEWDGKTEYGEWIRTSARIPLATYDRFVGQFNPTSFDASAWVRMAKDAGMKYIVITSKHHDGFCLFDSKETEFDVMSTPFKRDIMKELSEACKKEGITDVLVPLDHGLAQPRLPAEARLGKGPPDRGSRFRQVCGIHEKAAAGTPHQLR